MIIRIFVILFLSTSIFSCMEHNIHSSEADDVYFTKKDIVPVEEEKEEIFEEETGVEEVK